jgi:hypothetical protein
MYEQGVLQSLFETVTHAHNQSIVGMRDPIKRVGLKIRLWDML